MGMLRNLIENSSMIAMISLPRGIQGFLGIEVPWSCGYRTSGREAALLTNNQRFRINIGGNETADHGA
ncbi:Uncharacterised protein [Serratia liquefaciens]|nr:Uncharacterised protein [Serratia liquefaciens]